MKAKICKECGKELSLDNFYKNKKSKDGYEGKCKECKKKRQKEHYEENKDKILKRNKKYNKKYYEENKDKVKENRKKYYEENKDKEKEYQKEHYEENKDKILEHNKKYREENKDKIKENRKKYYEENKDKEKEYQKEYCKENPEKVFNNRNKRRSKLENQGRGITKEQYIECNNWFNWKCAYSGEKLQKNKSTYGRTLDHIIALNNEGLNEPWNIIPMRKGYNSSKNATENSLNWYKEQEYFDIDRLNKIVEWQIYAYEKWGGEEFGELILITDLLEN